MIISRTPLRMSFVGGGSDLPEFYRKHGGAVLSTAVDKYVYVTVNKKFDDGVRVAYSRTEEVTSAEHVQHPLVRHGLQILGVKGGVEITTVADIPSKGTGLGSSSSFTVGLLNALGAFQGRHMSSERLATDCCRIEIEICGEPIGKQDQFAAAYGGLNVIEFKKDDTVDVHPLIIESEVRRRIEESIIVFYTGIIRSASAVLKQQNAAIKSDLSKEDVLRQMAALSYELRDALQDGKVDAFGEILHKNWMLKKSLATEISNSEIDAWYEAARAAGATGGKILGAGAGGFLMFSAPPARHDRITGALSPLRRIPMRFESLGSRVIFYNPTSS
jgi:D-glycero-alpha-D-manno-heptose-7-phosphate kinase